ncbi:WD40-repeat-containing domain protein [Cladochytrium replicatum]|nr:WD40-repeat-containing domain protein [Cladochytrium replicatum]
MKLKLHQPPTKHTDIVSCVGWTGNNELFSCGDDRKIHRWSSDGEHLGSLNNTLFEVPVPATPAPVSASTSPERATTANLARRSSTNLLGTAGVAVAEKAQSGGLAGGGGTSVYATDLQWFPAGGKMQGVDVFVVGGTDGKFYVLSKAGRVDKAVEAHKGALLALRWNSEGSALVTAGEDGAVKIWSRSGMLRSTLMQLGYPTYAIAWSPDNDHILMTNGRNLIIKPIQPSSKPNQWKGHDGVILCADWNLVNDLILSGGEDRKYKVWDSYGRQIYSCAPHDHPITALAWNPSGELFAVGSFDLLRLCDKVGWSCTLDKPETGSISKIAWTPDGTQVACAGGNGSVIFGHIINRRYEWKNFEVTLLDDNKIRIFDLLQANTELLDFRDRVINVSLGFGYLVVVTSSQCYIHSEKNWNTPSIMDLPSNGRVVCIQQCSEYFCVVDNVNGIQIYTYDGRPVSSPKYPGLRAELLTASMVSISNDVLTVKDRVDEKVWYSTAIYVFEVTTGRAYPDCPIRHHTDILELQLNQTTSTAFFRRQLVVIDKNRDAYLVSSFVKGAGSKKLGSMVECMAWNDDGSDQLIGVVDGRVVQWAYPYGVFVDEEVALLGRFQRDGSQVGKNASIIQYYGTQCSVRKADGTIVNLSNVSPMPAMLQDHARKKQWEEAIRLCRYAKSKELWACLALMSIHGQDLNTAEVAYASIDEIQKVQYICQIRDIASPEARSAEMALLRRQPKEAESILIAANHIFRAIRMWIHLYNWDRALDLAIKYKTHVDTVLFFRSRYLSKMGRQETSKRFIQYSQSVPLDYPTILKKMRVDENG